MNILPVTAQSLLTTATRRSGVADGIIVVIGWQISNAMLFISLGLFAQRALTPSLTPPMIFAICLTADMMLNLVFIGSSLADPFFWIGLLVEIACEVVRDSGFLFDSATLAGDIGGAVGEVLIGRDNTTTVTSPIRDDHQPPQLKRQVSRQLSGHLLKIRRSARARFAASRVKQATQAAEQVEDEIARLGCLSELVSAAGIFSTLLLEELMQGYHVGELSITRGLTVPERRDTLRCFAVVFVAQASHRRSALMTGTRVEIVTLYLLSLIQVGASFLQKWLLAWKRRRRNEMLAQREGVRTSVEVSDGNNVDGDEEQEAANDDFPDHLRDPDGMHFWQLHGIYLVMVCVMTVQNCVRAAIQGRLEMQAELAAGVEEEE